MANSRQARKRARQALKRRARNMSLRSRMRTYVKKVMRAVEAGDREAAMEAFRAAQPIVDGAVNKGIIHRNKAARIKSRLNAHIKAMAS